MLCEAGSIARCLSREHQRLVELLYLQHRSLVHSLVGFLLTIVELLSDATCEVLCDELQRHLHIRLQHILQEVFEFDIRLFGIVDHITQRLPYPFSERVKRFREVLEERHALLELTCHRVGHFRLSLHHLTFSIRQLLFRDFILFTQTRHILIVETGTFSQQTIAQDFRVRIHIPGHAHLLSHVLIRLEALRVAVDG